MAHAAQLPRIPGDLQQGHPVDGGDAGLDGANGLAGLLSCHKPEWCVGLDGEQPSEAVRPIKTGIGAIDKMALLEVAWYARQLRRMGHGGEPKPRESAIWSFLASVSETGWGTMKTRRLRA